MQFKRPLPLFFLIILVVGILISPAHASGITFNSKVDGTCTGCASIVLASLTVSTNDAVVVSVGGGGTAGTTYTVTDSQGNIYAAKITQQNSQGSNIASIFTTLVATSVSDVVTVHVTPNQSMAAVASDYSGVAGFGNTAQQNSGSGSSAGATSTVTITSSSSQSFIVEQMFVAECCITSITASSAQTQRDYLTNSGANIAIGQFDITGLFGSTSLSLAWTGSAAGIALWTHLSLELLNTAPASTSGLITQCYGECGNPAITLTNPNATHPVNFNQSYTLFYTFQSGLNGVLLNVTTNVARNYNNGQEIALGVYTATCPPGATPFTISCAGALQPGFALSVPNVQKGKFSIGTNIPVVAGQWIAIAFTGIYSGLDLNQTNGTCGDTTSGICASPPGMSFTKGTIPQSISSSSPCTSNNSPCNIGSISSTGLWAWINGNIVINTPVPPPSIGCINTDLACFMIASACALTPSNCFIGGAVYLFIYFTIFVAGISICISWVNSSYEVELHFPPAIFFLFFLVELFMFTAMGLIPQYVTIVVFIFTALGVAGYFGSAFMGGRGRSE